MARNDAQLVDAHVRPEPAHQPLVVRLADRRILFVVAVDGHGYAIASASSLSSSTSSCSRRWRLSSLRVRAAARDQFVVRAALDDVPVFQHDDLVRPAHGRDAVRDHNRRAPADEVADAAKDPLLRISIDVRKRVIEHQHRRRAGEGAGDRRALLLPAG